MFIQKERNSHIANKYHWIKSILPKVTEFLDIEVIEETESVYSSREDYFILQDEVLSFDTNELSGKVSLPFLIFTC